MRQRDDLDAVLKTIVLDYPDMHRFDVYAAGTAAQLDRAQEHFVREGLHGSTLVCERDRRLNAAGLCFICGRCR